MQRAPLIVNVSGFLSGSSLAFLSSSWEFSLTSRRTAELVGNLFIDFAAVSRRENPQKPSPPIYPIDDAKAPHAVFSEPRQFS